MKMLSKSVLASILSTLVAASAMAQCPSGGCPWGSYNRNYGGSGGYSNYSYPQQGYYNAPSRGFYGHDGDHFDHSSNNAYPYPYGGQTYYNDFEDHKGFEHPAGGYEQGYNRSGFQQDDYYQGGQQAYDNSSDRDYGFSEHPAGNQGYSNQNFGNQGYNYNNQSYGSNQSFNTASQGQGSSTYTNPMPAPTQPNTNNPNAR